jgi:hypothetical protein
MSLGPLRQAFILFNHVSGYTAGFDRFWMSTRRLIGPLRQAFILFNHVSGYTAGFGRFWMSARRLKSVYSVV